MGNVLGGCVPNIASKLEVELCGKVADCIKDYADNEVDTL